jgi:hypothetical protein
MRRLLVIGAFAASFGMACFEEEPCDRYVDYVCQCHDGEEGFDCEEFRLVYADAAAGVQDECAIALDELQAADEAAGLTCDVAEEPAP